MRNDPESNRNFLTLDAEDQFNNIIDTAIDERVDFIIHSGDMFERVNVKNIDIQGALKALNRLSEANIPFVVIAGNHDRPFTKGVISPVAYVDFIKNCYSIPHYKTKKLTIDDQEIAIHGISYLKSDVEKDFAIISKKLLSQEVNYQILASHQSLQGAEVGFEWSNIPENPIQRSLYPSSVNYIAMGHIHKRQTQTHPQNEDLLMHYPGSPIVTDFSERNDDKAVTLVSLTGKEVEIHDIPLPTRPFIEPSIDLKNPEQSIDVETSIRSVIKNNLGNDKFLGIRLKGKIRFALRRVTMTNYYREYFNEFAGFKIFNHDARLTWYDQDGLSLTEGEQWLKSPLEELKIALSNQEGLNDQQKEILLENGAEIITEVMEEE